MRVTSFGSWAIALISVLASCRDAPRVDAAPSASSAPKLPSITIDPSHDASKQGAAPFSLDPTPALVFDGSSHTFTEPNSFGDTSPTAVHVLRGGTDEYYRTGWDPSGKTTLSATSLAPVRGQAAFKGFASGDKYMIAVGTERPGKDDEPLKFAPLWVTGVEVR